jgi:zinc D-Ala-D-Ala carboxypeptidase
MMKYFKYYEFDSPDVDGSGQMMDAEFLQLLDNARELYGKPMAINSGFRTEAHNQKVGGTANSSHLKGLAADIACTTSAERWDMIDSLMKAGFNRIGIAKTFIHVDIDESKTPFLIWTYA